MPKNGITFQVGPIFLVASVTGSTVARPLCYWVSLYSPSVFLAEQTIKSTWDFPRGIKCSRCLTHIALCRFPSSRTRLQFTGFAFASLSRYGKVFNCLPNMASSARRRWATLNQPSFLQTEQDELERWEANHVRVCDGCHCCCICPITLPLVCEL